MPALIVLDAHPDHPEDWNFLQDEQTLENRVFPSSEAADNWLCKNAKNGWVTLIIPVDEDD